MLAAFGCRTRIFVGEEKVELDTRVIDRIAGDYFVQVVPLAHHLIVLRDMRSNCSFKEGTECLD